MQTTLYYALVLGSKQLQDVLFVCLFTIVLYEDMLSHGCSTNEVKVYETLSQLYLETT
jgi:hypothetical protein